MKVAPSTWKGIPERVNEGFDRESDGRFEREWVTRLHGREKWTVPSSSADSEAPVTNTDRATKRA